jgi:2-polyprenyl-3-methyl-5-hydroxy-6-metoxy-1,4-benzoquinol methylase
MAAMMAQKTTLMVFVSAVSGAFIYAGLSKFLSSKKKVPDPEKDHSIAHQLVWSCIGGAMQSSMLYIGDRLNLYATLRECCAKDGSSITAIELSEITGLNQRWLREWLAQQAAMGVMLLLPGVGDDDDSLRYRLPRATAEVLADATSKEYDIAMIQTVPSLVARAKTMLPEAFRTGIGRPYDEPEVAEGIDRAHRTHIRDIVLPEVVTAAAHGRVLKMLQDGCVVADLGCGGGNLMLAMAHAFPNSTFHGFEVSKAALDIASHRVASSQLRNAFLHDANEASESLGDFKDTFDLVTTLDVLHDAPNPAELIAQVRAALKPDTGVWLLADIPSAPSIRENIAQNPTAGTYFAFSTCLCMSCSLSTATGAGLGTLGFSVPVAKKMLNEGGFNDVHVLLEKQNTRWFVVM